MKRNPVKEWRQRQQRRREKADQPMATMKPRIRLYATLNTPINFADPLVVGILLQAARLNEERWRRKELRGLLAIGTGSVLDIFPCGPRRKAS